MHLLSAPRFGKVEQTGFSHSTYTGTPSCRFSSNVDTFKGKKSAKYPETPKNELLPQLDLTPEQVTKAQKLCNRVITKEGRGLKVVDFMVHLLEYGPQKFSELTSGLVARSIDATKLRAALAALETVQEPRQKRRETWPGSGQYGSLPDSSNNLVSYSRLREQFAVTLEGLKFLKTAYPELRLPETLWVQHGDNIPAPFRNTVFCPKPKAAQLKTAALRELCDKPVGEDRLSRSHNVIDILVAKYDPVYDDTLTISKTKENIPKTDVQQLKTALSALEGQGLLYESWSHRHGEWGYALTSKGKQFLLDEYLDVMCAHGVHYAAEAEPLFEKRFNVKFTDAIKVASARFKNGSIY